MFYFLVKPAVTYHATCSISDYSQLIVTSIYPVPVGAVGTDLCSVPVSAIGTDLCPVPVSAIYS